MTEAEHKEFDGRAPTGVEPRQALWCSELFTQQQTITDSSRSKCTAFRDENVVFYSSSSKANMCFVEKNLKDGLDLLL